jgi:hypothetical protein
MCSAFCAVGSAIVTMVASSTISSWAAPMTMSANHRRGSAPGFIDLSRTVSESVDTRSPP